MSTFTPLRFGPDGRQLFGLLQLPAANPPSLGVLLCPPFGQEAIRTHRIMRILADRLVQAGAATLRFDYYGTGDSDGDDTEADLSRWQEDVRRADETLRQSTGATRTVWLGLRLGGTLALLAATQAGAAPSRIVTWDLVSDGPAYLEELARAQRKALGAGAVGCIETWRIAREPESRRPTKAEALGYPLTADFAAQVAAITPKALLDNARNVGVDRFVGAGTRSEEGEAIAADVAWTIDDSDDFPSVPLEAVRALVARCVSPA